MYKKKCQTGNKVYFIVIIVFLIVILQFNGFECVIKKKVKTINPVKRTRQPVI